MELKTTEKIHVCDAIKDRSKSEDEKKYANLEINALDFENKISNYLNPINPSVTLDKKIIKDIMSNFKGKCDQESIKYYQSVYKKTSNVFDKWRYAFCLWVLTKDPAFQNNTLNCLFTGIEKCMNQKRYDDSDSLLVVAFNFSRFYNLLNNSKRVKEKNKIIKLALGQIEAVKKTDHSHLMKSMVKVLISIERGISLKQAKHLILLLHNEAKSNQAKNMFSRSVGFLETSLDLCDKLGQAQKRKQKQDTQRMLAEAFEKEADFQLKKEGENRFFVAYDRWRKAIHWYRKLDQKSQKSKIEELTQKIDSLNLTDKMECIEYRTKIPRKQFASSNGYDLVKEIVDYAKSLIPNVSDITDNVKQDLNEHALPTAVTNVTFGEKNPATVDTDDKAIIQSQTILQLKLAIQLSDHHIASSVQELEMNEKISAQDFIVILSEYGVKGSLLELIRQGIHRHFAKDYISSIHILIPQVEGTLRYLLKSEGSKLLKIKGKDNIMHKELGLLLGEEDTKSLLKEDLTKFLRVRFTEQVGMNLRNEVSHANLEYKEFDYVNALSTIIAIMILAQRLMK